MIDKSCMEFVEALSSSAAVPGGGGASALVGAIGMALGSMVGNLTLGKKKYADVQDDIQAILKKAALLQEELMQLVQKDADVFEPLSKAYGLPKDTEEQIAEKDRVMEEALKLACSVPLDIMEKTMECVDLHEELAQKGTRIAISDVGVGILMVKAALIGASLNVCINTKLMKDRQFAEEINIKSDLLVSEGSKRADDVFKVVADQLK